ncbi:MAG TPA: short-chain fatty acyl-CoA regulator family protein [Beijerinckiaceae bacterium]|nr:short-chain fatty acyl-CoA regulator family protein [Beijerinckiaceae bacterium]
MRAVRIGGKLRRLRQEKRLNQAQMAAELSISPSYLNLLESNQRPVTVTVLLKLAERFQVDLASLGGGDDARLTSDLMEALSDPLFEGQDVKASDVRDVVATIPSIAQALVNLYQAYQRGGSAAKAGADDIEGEGQPAALPSEEVTEFLQRRLNYLPELEEAAETLWVDNGLALYTLQQDLVKVLAQKFAVDVEIVAAASMPGVLRSYNPLTRRLALSEMLPASSRTFQLAHQIAFLGYRREVEAAVSGGKFSTPEADALARSALANYFAAAVMMPYARFLDAARVTRYDLDVLQHRFGVSFEQACHRLTTLRRPGSEAVPFHLIRVDIAGNISKRFSASGIHIARFGAACPRWNVYDAFATPGMLRVQVSRMPDGQTFFCIARTISTAGRSLSRGGLPNRVGQLAIGLGCSSHHAREIVYADGLNLDDPQIVTPIGVSCRTCPRTDCADRAMPSLAQRLEIDENRRGMSTYALAT